VNIADFWRRWHISLSNWLRDYLFIPLGGSRGSRWATYRNLLIVMGLGGLWHGANWTFAAWGLTIGAWLCAHRAFQARVREWPRLDAALQSPPGTVLRALLTFVGVSLTWVIFRSPTLAQAHAMFAGLFRSPNVGKMEPIHLTNIGILIGVVALGHWLGNSGRWRQAFEAIPGTMLGFALAVAMTVVLILTPDAGKVFIYFQF
jgi:D-alanyl-lipoteichoic acid acyltransferase DltB (MBOAT superfamily)